MKSFKQNTTNYKKFLCPGIGLINTSVLLLNLIFVITVVKPHGVKFQINANVQLFDVVRS